MQVERREALTFTDTPVADVFIHEYLPHLSGDSVRVYLYLQYLSGTSRETAPDYLSGKLKIQPDVLEQSLRELETCGALTRMDDKLVLTDLKEKEVLKNYRVKVQSTLEDVRANSQRHKDRSELIRAINTRFFGGSMDTSWYLEIDALLDQYKFDNEVLLSLFEHGRTQTGGINRNYLRAVARGWHDSRIVTSLDLERYFEQQSRLKEAKHVISRRLNLYNPPTEYEESLILKWTRDWELPMEVVECAMRRVTSRTRNVFRFMDNLLSEWQRLGLKTADAVEAHVAANRPQPGTAQKPSGQPYRRQPTQMGNYDQRQYDDQFFESFVANVPDEPDDSSGGSR